MKFQSFRRKRPLKWKFLESSLPYPSRFFQIHLTSNPKSTYFERPSFFQSKLKSTKIRNGKVPKLEYFFLKGKFHSVLLLRVKPWFKFSWDFIAVSFETVIPTLTGVLSWIFLSSLKNHSSLLRKTSIDGIGAGSRLGVKIRKNI